MHHNVFGKKLSRTSNERRNLFRNLMMSLIVNGSIKTTKTKAQAVRGEVEKLITKAKRGTETMRRDILSTIVDRNIVDQLMEKAKTQFASRTSGYTRIVKIGTRRGDATEMVVLSFVDQAVATEVIAPTKKEAPVKVEKKEVKKAVVKKDPAPKKKAVK